MTVATPLRERLDRLDAIARLLTHQRKKQGNPEIDFLVNALWRTAAGENPLDAFDVRAKRGERRGTSIRKIAPSKPKSAIVTRINRLIKIANHLHHGKTLPTHDRSFLVSALRNIAAGQQPDMALETRANAGEHKNRKRARLRLVRPLALCWIANAIEDDPIHSAPQMKLDDALQEAALHFGYTYESLRKIWTHATPKPSSILK